MIGVASVLWLRHQALHNRLQQVRSFSSEAADHIGQEQGLVAQPDALYRWIDNTQRKYKLPGQFGVTIYDANGMKLYHKNAPKRPGEPPPRQGPPLYAPPPRADRVDVRQAGGFYTITTPIRRQGADAGTLVIAYARDELMNINPHYGLISSLLLLSGLLGWFILYWLLRKMSKPIRRVIQAFKQIESGNYKLLLEETAKEQEVYDLLVYYNAMAERLEQMEQLRTELLAGVTHELRTPITSIRGLTRAVRDQVVESDEADEFLDLSLKETNRLEQMVADLLHFNAYASGSIRLHAQYLDLGKLLTEIAYQWSLVNRTEGIEMRIDLPNDKLTGYGDADRIEQIIVNLLNNSLQAMNGGTGSIAIQAGSYSIAHYEVLVQDTGCGIPAAEQVNIFERYYRGTNKRQKVRGLGLGLTLCRMLADAMNGSLKLRESSPAGTTFELLLPKGSKNG